VKECDGSVEELDVPGPSVILEQGAAAVYAWDLAFEAAIICIADLSGIYA
jgi:hypothetical protein